MFHRSTEMENKDIINYMQKHQDWNVHYKLRSIFWDHAGHKGFTPSANNSKSCDSNSWPIAVLQKAIHELHQVSKGQTKSRNNSREKCMSHNPLCIQSGDPYYLSLIWNLSIILVEQSHDFHGGDWGGSTHKQGQIQGLE